MSKFDRISIWLHALVRRRASCRDYITFTRIERETNRKSKTKQKKKPNPFGIGRVDLNRLWREKNEWKWKCLRDTGRWLMVDWSAWAWHNFEGYRPHAWEYNAFRASRRSVKDLSLSRTKCMKFINQIRNASEQRTAAAAAAKSKWKTQRTVARWMNWLGSTVSRRWWNEKPFQIFNSIES